MTLKTLNIPGFMLLVIISIVHLQDDINKLSQWFKDNKLTKNIDKTFLIPIGSKQRLSQLRNYIMHIRMNICYHGSMKVNI